MGQVCIIFLSAVGCSANHGLSEVSLRLSKEWAKFMNNLTGSGSTYVYGYCDATYQEGWGRDETVNFVKNSESYHLHVQYPHS